MCDAAGAHDEAISEADEAEADVGECEAGTSVDFGSRVACRITHTLPCQPVRPPSNHTETECDTVGVRAEGFASGRPGTPTTRVFDRPRCIQRVGARTPKGWQPRE